MSFVFSAASNLMQGDAASQAANYNSKILEGEGRAAELSALNDEATQRSQSRIALGRQAAAVAQSGTGFGGTNERLMDQSAIDAELDALNIRYKGTLARFGYRAQAANERYEGKTAKLNSYLLAGADVLKGASNYGTGG